MLLCMICPVCAVRTAGGRGKYQKVLVHSMSEHIHARRQESPEHASMALGQCVSREKGESRERERGKSRERDECRETEVRAEREAREERGVRPERET